MKLRQAKSSWARTHTFLSVPNFTNSASSSFSAMSGGKLPAPSLDQRQQPVRQ